MKQCGLCGERKPFTSFHRRGKGHQSICKPCRKLDDHRRYADDQERHWAIREQRRRELAKWMFKLKSSQSCTDCGNSFHPSAMQWDHTGIDKLLNVSDAVNRGWSKRTILAEIAKCELVCANCHAVRTYNRRQLDVAHQQSTPFGTGR